MTDENFSRSIQLMNWEQTLRLAEKRPPAVEMSFGDEEAKRHAWLHKFALFLQTLGGDRFAEELKWLKRTISHQETSLRGTVSLEQIVADLRRIGRAAPGQPALLGHGQPGHMFPPDILIQLFPGHDIHLPVDSLVDVQGSWDAQLPRCHAQARVVYLLQFVDMVCSLALSHVFCFWDTEFASALVSRPGPTPCEEGSLIIVRPGANSARLFYFGVIVQLGQGPDSALAQWFVPDISMEARIGGGRKKQIPDIFGPWLAADEVPLAEAGEITSPLVQASQVICWGFELDDIGQLPFEVFDKLYSVGIDCTGLSVSSTSRGQLYRHHRLMSAIK